jgi:membrane protein DedA with SNARE-associated domain
MAIQMAAIITLGVFGGKKLDQFFNLKQPVFTLVLSFFAVFAAIYVSIKDFLKNKK